MQRARREFIKATGSGVLVAAGANIFVDRLPQSDYDSRDPVSSKPPRMIPGCCAYSYRRELLGGKMTLEGFIEKAVELRLAAIDMTVYYLKSTEPSYLSNLRYLAYKNAVALSGAACGVSMVLSDATKRKESLEQIKHWVDVTDRLGASHLRVFAGEIPSDRTLTEAISWVVETMKAATDYSGRKGIVLGIEDHDGVSQNADVCLEIMHRVNSEYAGINIDITHFVPTGTQDAYSQIAACIPFATNTHIRPTFDDGTPVDLERIWKLFAQAGFRGYMSYEGDELSTPGLVPAPLLEIQRLCKKYSSL